MQPPRKNGKLDENKGENPKDLHRRSRWVGQRRSLPRRLIRPVRGR